jgi:MYXO-CTERM domain-containing protein
MKKIATILSLIIVTSLTKADLIADWEFNSGTTAASPGGSQMSTATLTTPSDVSATVSTISGTKQNSLDNTTGGSLIIAAGGQTAGENGQSVVFSFNTSGYQNLILSYATLRSGTGYLEQDVYYSINGGSYIQATSFTDAADGTGPIPTPTGTISTSSYAVETVNFSSDLNNDPTVSIEIILKNATGTSGSTHFDNFQLNASPVPEPGTWGAISGAGLLGLCGVRAWRQRRQQNAAV